METKWCKLLIWINDKSHKPIEMTGRGVCVMSELRQEEVQRTNVRVMNPQKVQPDDEMEIDLL